MAEIETSVLRIGSNDLILQDAAGRGSLADAYNASSTYAVGDMVLKDGQLYECNTAILTAEAWTAAHWTAVTVGEKVADLEADTSQLKEDYTTILDSAYVTDTASGSIASFPDGADGVPVKSLTVDVEPVQDLHGQDAPYPGGGGKNKLNLVSVFGGDGSYSADGSTYTLSMITNRPLVQFAEEDGNYILTWDNSAWGGTATNVRLEFYNSADVLITSRYINEATPYAVNGVCKVKANYSVNGSVSIKNPMIRLSTVSDATFAPYENICPISGHTSAVVTRTGFNVWDEEWVNGRWAGNNGVFNPAFSTYVACKNKIPVKPSTTYYFYVDTSVSTVREIVYYDKNENWISDEASIYQNNTFTTPSGCYYIAFNFGSNYGVTYSNNVSINYPSTDHDYHAYDGQTVTIDLDGTRYGCTLKATQGQLVVDRVIKNSGFSRGSLDSSRKLYTIASLPDAKLNSDTNILIDGIISNMFPVLALSPARQSTAPCLAYYGSGTVTVYVGGYVGNETALDNLLSSLMLVYPLATPFTVQLTAEEVSTLKGQNNIWADTGNVEVEYRADTKLYIEKLTAPTEDDMVADHAISANSFFMVGNTLYRATTAIASGATITVGTNAVKLSLSDALNTLS